jgi:serine/threonine protein kinase
VSELGDRALDHLRRVAAWPEVPGARYVVGGELARGGMGVVYSARDLDLDRDVAVKVIAPEAADAGLATRLLREARIIARLEHPGIVPVHDVGTLPDGRVYYAMKLVTGKRLDVVAREGLPLRERLRLFLRLCEPVAFAHAHGVIHRDLKPENVMVGPFGEVLVMDWGIAKVVREAPEASPAPPPAADPPGASAAAEGTAHGTVLGTPAYMAPEQARGEVERVDERSDVHALGAVLYFLLTGHAPGRAPADPAAPTRTRAGHMSPPPPGVDFAGAGAVQRPLQAICRKALAAEPTARYAGVSELAQDVARFLEGERVSACPEGPLQKAGRLALRHRTPILLVLAYLVARVVLLILARV